jgi:hypothetical protein
MDVSYFRDLSLPASEADDWSPSHQFVHITNMLLSHLTCLHFKSSSKPENSCSLVPRRTRYKRCIGLCSLLPRGANLNVPNGREESWGGGRDAEMDVSPCHQAMTDERVESEE